MDIWTQENKAGEDLESLARLFADLSHPLRLAAVIRLIMQGTECVCSLARGLDVDQPTLSRHLRILKDHGVVADRRRGAKVFYHVIKPRAVAILNCSEVLDRTDPRRKADGVAHGAANGRAQERRTQGAERG